MEGRSGLVDMTSHEGDFIVSLVTGKFANILLVTYAIYALVEPCK